MADVTFVRDAIDIFKSMFEGIKIIDPYEMGLRYILGSLHEKRYTDRMLIEREKILREFYEANSIDIKIEKDQYKRLVTEEREVMIALGKMKPNKVKRLKASKVDMNTSIDNLVTQEVDQSVTSDKLIKKTEELEPKISPEKIKQDVNKSKSSDKTIKDPYQIGRTSLLKTHNPFIRPDYGPNFRKDFFGRAWHDDRYSSSLIHGWYLQLPEFWLKLMRIAVVPINVDTKELKPISVSVQDEDDKGPISIDIGLLYSVVGPAKAYNHTQQYVDFLQTTSKNYLGELGRNRTYDFWKGDCKVSPDLAQEIDKNIAAGLIKGLFIQENDIYVYNKKILNINQKKDVKDMKSMDDLVDTNKFYDKNNGPMFRSNTSLVDLQLKTALNYELIKNFGIYIISLAIRTAVPAKVQRILHSGYIVPNEISISTSVDSKTPEDY